MLYIHHVPGRLRLRIQRLKGDGPAAGTARDKAITIPGVLEARVSTVTGSLVIFYERKELTLAALWEALCERSLASGPLPFLESVPVARAQVGRFFGAAGKSLVELVTGAILDCLLRRSAAALVAALI
jgi:hypothetical protein